ncbi:MAG: polysaccharide biosynthesis C-terminal domain-containing protein [Prevotella sp.]|nr:polysaccharide biosynthesis C-terminal domain-containing protein [Prevotella sp.]
MPIQSSNISAIKALGHSDITLKTEIIKKILETIILIVSFCINIYAVAWGIVIYNFICIAINLYPCKKLLNYGVMEQIRDTAPYALLSAIMGFSIYSLSLLNCPLVWLLVLQSVSGLTIYILLNALTKTNCYIYTRNIISEKFLKKNRLL